MSTAEEHMESGERAFGDLTRRVIHGEERLSEIITRFESKFEKLNDSIQELNRTIAAVGKPDYKTWTAIGGLCFTAVGAVSWIVWMLIITPINHQIDIVLPTQFDKDIARLENDIKARATKDDLNRLIIETDRRLPRAKEK